MITQESLHLRFIATSYRESLIYEQFLLFIGIIPINKTKKETTKKDDALLIVSKLVEKLGLSIDGVLGEDIDGVLGEDIDGVLGEDIDGVLGEGHSKIYFEKIGGYDISSFDVLKQILIERLGSDMIPFEDVLKIFQENKLYTIFNMVDFMYFFRHIMKFNRKDQIIPKKETTKAVIEKMENADKVLKTAIGQLEKVLKQNQNNPYVLYSIVWCKSVSIFICEKITDKPSCYWVNEEVEELYNKGFFAAMISSYLEYSARRTCDSIISCFPEYKNAWYRNMVVRLNRGYVEPKQYYTMAKFFKKKFNDDIAYNIIMAEGTLLEYKIKAKELKNNIWNRAYQEEELKILKIRYFNTVSSYLEDTFVLSMCSSGNYIENIMVIYAHTQRHKFYTYIPDDIDDRITEHTIGYFRYLAKCREQYVFLFEEDWKIFYNFLLGMFKKKV